MYFILFTVFLAFAVWQILMYLYVYEPDYVYELASEELFYVALDTNPSSKGS